MRTCSFSDNVSTLSVPSLDVKLEEIDGGPKEMTSNKHLEATVSKIESNKDC